MFFLVRSTGPDSSPIRQKNGSVPATFYIRHVGLFIFQLNLCSEFKKTFQEFSSKSSSSSKQKLLFLLKSTFPRKIYSCQTAFTLNKGMISKRH
jgi:hypothetical protein